MRCSRPSCGAGRYRFDNLSRVTRRDREEVEIWSSRDALVLKALALVLAEHLPVSRSCTHVKGHGGAKAAVRSVWQQVPANRFVLRTGREVLLRLDRPPAPVRAASNRIWARVQPSPCSPRWRRPTSQLMRDKRDSGGSCPRFR
jgi:hypothetical protein